MRQPTDTSSGCWHRAGWVIIDPKTIRRDAMIHVCANRITDVKTGRKIGQDPIVDHGPGVLMPALINAHTHLELSALKGKLPLDHGFDTWVRHLIHSREKLSREELESGISDGICELLDTGCGAVGEIATLGLSRMPFLQSPLHGVWFKEYIGNNADGGTNGDSKFLEMEMGSESLAGHAPHTTSPDLLVALKQKTRRLGRPLSIHLAESKDEIDFIRTGTGTWANLLKTRGIDYSNWPVPAESPVRYLDQLNLLDEKTIAVHVLHADIEDYHILSRRGVDVAVCPRSNQLLHQRLPDLASMRKAGLTICLGTDSLASCDSLSMFDEMAFAAKQFPTLSPPTLFAMATTNAACALGLKNDCGQIAPGYRANCLYVPLSAAKPDILLEQVVTAQFNHPIEILNRYAK